MTEQQKLYACRTCNIISMKSWCGCESPNTDQLTMYHVEHEKPSIGNEDVFDRIDRELQDIRNLSHTDFEHLSKKIKSLEDLDIDYERKLTEKVLLNISQDHVNKLNLLEDRFEDFLSNFDTLCNKIKSLEDKLEMSRDTISCVDRAYDEQVELLYSKITSLEDKVRKHEITCPHDKVKALIDESQIQKNQINKSQKEIENLQNRFGQLLVNSQLSNTPDTKCSHTNTEDYLSFDNFESRENVKEIYTLCLDCKEKIS